jgi:hypothetical protein
MTMEIIANVGDMIIAIVATAGGLGFTGYQLHKNTISPNLSAAFPLDKKLSNRLVN